MLIYILVGFASVASLLLFGRTVQIIRRYNYGAVASSADSTPTVSVCIAARNETHALAQCLERVLKSDYVKLEVLVLDDSSTDDTSLIIKSFASAGVRFIPGNELPDGWLGKNHAYQTLINESSGDVILFLDVDTTIRSDSISSLVNTLLSSGKSMISVLPQRSDGGHISAILNTFRYHWELLLGTKQSPPAASALWMVEKSALQTTGAALENYSKSVRPERHLARQLQKSNAYRYYLSSSKFGVGFEKRMDSQWETAIRLYYPMAGRNFFSWSLSTLFIALLLVPNIIILLATVSWQFNSTQLNWAYFAALFNTVTLTILFKRLHTGHIWRFRLLLWPGLLLQELLLLTLSFVHYRTNTVTWKGRHVSARPAQSEQLRINE